MAGLRTKVAGKGVAMNEAVINEILTPEVILETGKKMRKSLLANVTPQELQQLIARASPEERLAGLAPEERLAGLAPNEILAGLAPDEILALFKQIEAYLRTQAPETGRSPGQSGQAEAEPPLSNDDE
jgi:hypothetical protein